MYSTRRRCGIAVARVQHDRRGRRIRPERADGAGRQSGRARSGRRRRRGSPRRARSGDVGRTSRFRGADGLLSGSGRGIEHSDLRFGGEAGSVDTGGPAQARWGDRSNASRIDSTLHDTGCRGRASGERLLGAPTAAVGAFPGRRRMRSHRMAAPLPASQPTAWPGARAEITSHDPDIPAPDRQEDAAAIPPRRPQINQTVKQQREQKRQEKLAEYQKQLAKRRRSKLVWWIVGSVVAIGVIAVDRRLDRLRAAAAAGATPRQRRRRRDRGRRDVRAHTRTTSRAPSTTSRRPPPAATTTRCGSTAASTTSRCRTRTPCTRSSTAPSGSPTTPPRHAATSSPP